MPNILSSRELDRMFKRKAKFKIGQIVQAKMSYSFPHNPYRQGWDPLYSMVYPLWGVCNDGRVRYFDYGRTVTGKIVEYYADISNGKVNFYYIIRITFDRPVQCAAKEQFNPYKFVEKCGYKDVFFYWHESRLSLAAEEKTVNEFVGSTIQTKTTEIEEYEDGTKKETVYEIDIDKIYQIIDISKLSKDRIAEYARDRNLKDREEWILRGGFSLSRY